MDMLDWLDKTDYKIKFGWIDKECLGCVDFERKTIYLNPSLILIHVFIHEYCHAVHRDPNEKRTDAREAKALKRMSVKKMKKLSVRLLEMWAGRKK